MKRIKLGKLFCRILVATWTALSSAWFQLRKLLTSGLRKLLPAWLRRLLPSWVRRRLPLFDSSKKFRKLQSLMYRAVRAAKGTLRVSFDEDGIPFLVPSDSPDMGDSASLSISLENNPHVPPGVRTRPARFDDPAVPAVVVPMFPPGSRPQDGERVEEEGIKDAIQ